MTRLLLATYFNPDIDFSAKQAGYSSRFVTFNNTSGFLYVSVSPSSEAIPKKIVSQDMAISSCAHFELFHALPLQWHTAQKHAEKPVSLLNAACTCCSGRGSQQLPLLWRPLNCAAIGLRGHALWQVNNVIGGVFKVGVKCVKLN